MELLNEFFAHLKWKQGNLLINMIQFGSKILIIMKCKTANPQTFSSESPTYTFHKRTLFLQLSCLYLYPIPPLFVDYSIKVILFVALKPSSIFRKNFNNFPFLSIIIPIHDSWEYSPSLLTFHISPNNRIHDYLFFSEYDSLFFHDSSSKIFLKTFCYFSYIIRVL